VQKYISLTGHVYSPHLVMINEKKFQSLTEEQQKILTEAMAEATKLQRQRAVELDGQIEKKFKDRGNVVIPVTAEEKAQWRKVAEDGGVYELVKSKMDHPEFLTKALSREY
jgi:TRAP-type C4-dicarboxylate transport system substrate-binding protein